VIKATGQKTSMSDRPGTCKPSAMTAIGSQLNADSTKQGSGRCACRSLETDQAISQEGHPRLLLTLSSA
jgi:hypothetical protein